MACGGYTGKHTTSRRLQSTIRVMLAHCFHAIRTTAACFGSVVSSGGKHWIELTKGLDITDLFEVHHLNFDKASAVLPKYYVKVKPRLSTGRAP